MKQKFLAGIIILLLFSSCNKKCHKVKYFGLGDVTRNSIPYQDGQNLVFKTNQSDTFITKVQRVYDVLEGFAPRDCEEYDEVNIKCPDSTQYFMQFLLRGCCGGDSMVQLTIFATPGAPGNIFQFVVKEDGRMDAFYLSPHTYIFHSSILIAGQPYSDVLEIKSILQEDTDVIQLFYNKQYGLIWCKTKAGRIVKR